MESLDWIFLRTKPTLALIAVEELDPAYAAIVAKRIDSTFPHTSSILSMMEDHGLIKARPEGRIRYLELTDQGRRVVKELKSLKEALRSPGVNWKRLERLKEIIESNRTGEERKLGPLRRDICILKGLGNEDLRKSAEDLDKKILSAIRK